MASVIIRKLNQDLRLLVGERVKEFFKVIDISDVHVKHAIFLYYLLKMFVRWPLPGTPSSMHKSKMTSRGSLSP